MTTKEIGPIWYIGNSFGRGGYYYDVPLTQKGFPECGSDVNTQVYKIKTVQKGFALDILKCKKAKGEAVDELEWEVANAMPPYVLFTAKKGQGLFGWCQALAYDEKE